MLRHLLLTVLLFSLFMPEAPAQRRDNLALAMEAYEDGVNFLLAGKAKKASKSLKKRTRLYSLQKFIGFLVCLLSTMVTIGLITIYKDAPFIVGENHELQQILLLKGININGWVCL